MKQPTPTHQNKPGPDSESAPGFFRRITAAIYDAILLFAVLFAATALLVPFSLEEILRGWHVILYRCYLLGIAFLFYGWFWTHGGQTLGLRAWKLTVLTQNRQPISWKQALSRFCFALLSWTFFGLGFLWILIDKNKLAWHDHLSKTRIFLDAPPPR